MTRVIVRGSQCLPLAIRRFRAKNSDSPAPWVEAVSNTIRYLPGSIHPSVFRMAHGSIGPVRLLGRSRTREANGAGGAVSPSGTAARRNVNPHTYSLCFIRDGTFGRQQRCR